jgi:hypothetical protein
LPHPTRRGLFVGALFGLCLVLAGTLAPPAAAATYDQAVLAHSPAAYWRLASAADSSGHGNTGSFAGGVTLGASGLINDPNTSASFDGNDDRMYFSDSASLSPTAAISLEAWIRPNAVSTASGSAWHLISKWNTALLYIAGGASPKFVFSLYNTGTSSYGSNVSSTTTVRAAVTYHVVGTYDGTTMRLYVNGVLEGSVARSGSVNDSTYGGVLAGGGWGTLPSPAFQGRLDEVAIYGRALTAAEVQTDFNTGTSPSTAFSVNSSIANGSTLSGALVWEATPSRAASKVDFYIDSTLKWTESVAPYVFNGDGNTLDTRTLTNASHVLKLVATATDGTTAQTSVTVQVANGSTGGASAGHILYMAPKADSSMVGFIDNSTATQQQWMRDHWQRAVVAGGYWDSKLSWYSNAWAYLDAYAIYNPSSTATQHPDWILKDSAGRKLYIPWGCSNGTCPQYAADIGNSAWRQDYINRCKALVAKGYKGIFADDVDMDMNVGNGSGQQVVPIDPRTGAPMSDAAWKSYFATFMEQLRTAIPTAEIAHNALWFAGQGLHDGTQPEISREIKAANYFNMERGFNDGGLTGGTGIWSVYAMFRFIDTVHSYGRHVVIQSYANDVTSAEYNLAGYFLINDGRDYVSTTIGAMPSNWWSGYTTDLGDATSGRYQWNGVWRRNFTRGFVLLNEPGATTKTLALGGSYKTTAGKVVSSVTLGAARGAVLTS